MQYKLYYNDALPNLNISLKIQKDYFTLKQNELYSTDDITRSEPQVLN